MNAASAAYGLPIRWISEIISAGFSAPRRLPVITRRIVAAGLIATKKIIQATIAMNSLPPLITSSNVTSTPRTKIDRGVLVRQVFADQIVIGQRVI